MYPKPISHSPKNSLAEMRETAKAKNLSSKYVPSVSEANTNEILHLLPRKGTIGNFQTVAF